MLRGGKEMGGGGRKRRGGRMRNAKKETKNSENRKPHWTLCALAMACYRVRSRRTACSRSGSSLRSAIGHVICSLEKVFSLSLLRLARSSRSVWQEEQRDVAKIKRRGKNRETRQEQRDVGKTKSHNAQTPSKQHTFLLVAGHVT